VIGQDMGIPLIQMTNAPITVHVFILLTCLAWVFPRNKAFVCGESRMLRGDLKMAEAESDVDSVASNESDEINDLGEFNLVQISARERENLQRQWQTHFGDSDSDSDGEFEGFYEIDTYTERVFDDWSKTESDRNVVDFTHCCNFFISYYFFMKPTPN